MLVNPRPRDAASAPKAGGSAPGNVVAGAFLALLYLLSRLTHLTWTSLHWDEATFLYRAALIGGDWERRFVGAAAGGKQPLHVWLIVLAGRVIADPVLAGRLVSVVTGAVAAIGLWLLARRLFSTRTAWLAVLLYILVPYTLLFDRQILIDSMLSAQLIWLLYLAVCALDRRGLPQAAGLAVAIALVFGSALLSKSPAMGFPLLMPFVLLSACPAELSWRRRLRWAATVALGLFGGWLIYYAVFGSTPAAAAVAEFERNHGRYTMSLEQLLGLPWEHWRLNASWAITWLFNLLTPPVFAIACGALFALPWLGRRATMLAACAVLPMAGQVAIALRIYDRYLLFGIPPLLLLVAYTLDRFAALPFWSELPRRRAAWLAAAGMLGVLAPAAGLDYRLLTDLVLANQTTTGVAGVVPARDYLIARAQVNPVVVLVDNNAGPVEDGLSFMLRGLPNLTVLRVLADDYDAGGAIVDPDTGREYRSADLAGYDVYYAHGSEGVGFNTWFYGDRMTLVVSFPNERGDDSFVGLYRVRYYGPSRAAVAEQIQALGHPEDAIVLIRKRLAEIQDFFPGDARFVPVPQSAATDRTALAAELERAVTGPRRVFVLTWQDDPPEATQNLRDWLSVHAYPAWGEWYGRIHVELYEALAAIPEAPTTVYAQGDEVLFGDALILYGVAGLGAPVSPGDVLPLALFWSASGPLPGRYNAFAHLLDAQGQLVAQHDAALPDPASWAPGRLTRDLHGLLLPARLPPGQYVLRVGVYDAESGARLPVTVAGTGAGDAYTLGELAVLSAAP